MSETKKMDWVDFVTVNDIDYKFDVISVSSVVSECKLCNALVMNKLAHAEYHYLKGEKPA